MINEEKIDISKVIEKIKEKKTFIEIIPEDFAKEEGYAYIIAKNVNDKMKVNQLRKIFTQIKKIENEIKGKKEEDVLDKTKIILLLPELAYAYGRNLITKDFYDLMKICLNDKLIHKKDFNNFVKFLSAILSYHKMLSK